MKIMAMLKALVKKNQAQSKTRKSIHFDDIIRRRT
jgi:hypothetical protein